MSDRPNRNEEIGDALARAFDPVADWAKRKIWWPFASVLDGVFEPKPIDINVDPTVVEVYMPNGKWCWAKMRAWQLDPITALPIALWLKRTDAPKDWVRIWPAEGMDTKTVAIDEADRANLDDDLLEIKLVAGLGGTVAKVAGSHGKAMAVGTDGKLIARNTDTTTRGGLMEKTADSPTITRDLFTDPADSIEKVRHRVACSLLTPLPPIAGGAPGNSGEVSDAKHQHPLESPESVGSYLYPVRRVSRAPSIVTNKPTVTTLTAVEYAIPFSDSHLAEFHGHSIGFTFASLPDDDEQYLVGIKATVTEAFAGPDLTSLEFSADTRLRSYSYLDPGDTVQEYDVQLLPRAVTGQSWDLFGEQAGSEYSENQWPAIQAVEVAGSDSEGITCWFTSHGCLLDGLTAGSLTITLQFERRVPPNTQTFARVDFYHYPGSYDGGADSSTFDLDCPIEPNAGLVLTGIRVVVVEQWLADGAGEILLSIANKQGQVVFSGLGLRNHPVGKEWSFSGLRISMSEQLRATVGRGGLATVGDITAGVLQIEYTVEQTTGGEVTTIDYRALTAAQATEADKEPCEFNCQIRASSGETLVGQAFATLAGTPGVTSIPAEAHKFRILGRIDYLGNTNWATANRWRGKVAVLRYGEATPDPPYLVVDGPLMYNTEDSAWEFEGTPTSPPTITSLDTLVIEVYAVTNSTDEVGFYFSQDTYLSTWIRMPVTMGGAFGTLNHFQLTPASRGFTAEQAAVTGVFTHPWSSLYPDRPRVLDRTAATVAGVLTVPTDCGTILRVSGTEPLHTISTDGFDLLSRLTLVFTEGRDVQHATGNIDTMQPANADPVITVVARDTMTLYLDEISSTKTWIRSSAR